MYYGVDIRGKKTGLCGRVLVGGPDQLGGEMEAIYSRMLGRGDWVAVDQ